LSDVRIRSYRPTDERGVIDVWNATLVVDPLPDDEWRGRFLLDPNFRRDNLLVAQLGDQIAGFVLGMRDGSQDAWIVAFGVRPDMQRRGIGTKLFTTLFDKWQREDVRQVTISSYVPGYITPGVDIHAYASAIAFLEQVGATELYRPVSMKANLTGYRLSEGLGEKERLLNGEGFTFRAARPLDTLPLVEFAEEHFGTPWRNDIASVLRELFVGDPHRVTLQVVLEGERIVGYAQSRAERFGPFGVDARLRGRGIGGVLLAQALLNMRRRGFHSAWFLWTSDRTAKLYGEHGFELVRRFAVFKKELNP
jgi:GNAT superfamily N-acetyltransferase